MDCAGTEVRTLQATWASEMHCSLDLYWNSAGGTRTMLDTVPPASAMR